MRVHTYVTCCMGLRHLFRQVLMLRIRRAHPICFLGRSNDIDHIYRRLLEASDGSPPWERALVDLRSASCRTFYRCSGRLHT